MTKQKHVIVVVFGEDATDAYYNGGLKQLQEVIENGDGRVVKREFDTEKEAEAYQLGIDDMDGWLSYATIEEDELNKHQRIINKLTK